MSDYFFSEPNYNKQGDTELLEKILSLSEFSSKNLKQLHTAVLTSDNTNERLDYIAKMCMISSSLSLMSLAYYTENYKLFEEIRSLLIEIQR